MSNKDLINLIRCINVINYECSYQDYFRFQQELNACNDIYKAYSVIMSWYAWLVL